MRKKLSVIITTLIMCIIMCSTIVMSTNVAISSNGIGTSKDTVTIGEEFELRLVIPSISQKVSSVQFGITFDNSAFEVTTYQPTQLAGATYSPLADSNKGGILTYSITSSSGENDIDFSSGMTIVAKLKVKQGASENASYVFNVSTYIIKSVNSDGYTYTSQAPSGVNMGTSIKVVHALQKTEAVAATCTTSGHNAYYTCTICNQVFKDAAGTIPTTVAAETLTQGSHTLQKIEAVASTCTTQGHNAYYKCTACNQVFKDAAGTTSTTVEAETLALGGHSLQKVEAVASTCTSKGHNAYYKCTVCNKILKEDKVTETSIEAETRSLIAHTLTEHKAVSATHEEDGNIAYWTCSVCKNYFKDKNGTQAISVAQTVVPATGHNYGDYKNTSTEHWKECSCGSETGRGTHTFQWKVDKEATEESTGLQHEECTVCGYRKNENTVIEKMTHVHTIVKIEAKDATCTQDGNIAYYTCTSCNKIYSDAEGKKEIDIASTVIEATGHVNTSLQSDGKYHWEQCNVCHMVIDDSKEAHIDSNADMICDWCDGALTTETIEMESSTEESSTEEVSEFETTEEETSAEGKTEEETLEVSQEETNESIEESVPTDVSTDHTSKLTFWGWILIVLLACGIIASIVIVSIVYFSKRKR